MRHLILVTLAVLALPLAAALAGAPATGVLPGRTVLSLNGGAVQSGFFPPVADGAVALPDGGALLVISDHIGVELVQVTGRGVLDPSFGAGGVRRVAWPSDVAPGGVVRQPDGRLIVLGATRSLAGDRDPQLVAVRVNLDGSLDPGYGTSGVAMPGLQDSCSCPHPAFETADGSLVLTGSLGDSVNDNRWVVERLTPSGTLDPKFGHGGVSTLGPAGTAGDEVTPLPDGSMLALGSAQGAPSVPSGHNLLLTRLSAGGLPDRGFARGRPLGIPSNTGAGDVQPRSDGSAVVSGFGQVVLVGPSGTIASRPVTVGADGAPTPLLQGPSGSVLMRTDSTTVKQVAANGAVGAFASLRLAFGGWVGGGVPIGDTLVRLPRSGIDVSLLRLAGGSYLAYGIVGLERRATTAAGAANSVFDVALTGLTPAMTPDPAFGGPGSALNVAVSAANPRVAAVHGADTLSVALTPSAASLARVVMRSGSTIVAQAVAPLLTPRRQTVAVRLTPAGRGYLHAHPHARLALSVTVRDLIGRESTATGSLVVG